MFHVGRFDPRDEERKTNKRNPSSSSKKKKKQRKRKLDQDDPSKDVSTSSPQQRGNEHHNQREPPASTLKVIAPEAVEVNQKSKTIHDWTDEALDDLEDVIAEDAGPTPPNPIGPRAEVKHALYMSTLPIEEASKQWNLAPFLVRNLQREEHFTAFFPIQALVIPNVLASERRSSQQQVRDVCVGAPTGSGKTLSFVLPILQVLHTRRIRRLRALVVLPSRDLASQVYRVFEQYVEGSDLRVGLAIGQSDFSAEQRNLILESGCEEHRQHHARHDSNRDLSNQISTLRIRQRLDHPTSLRVARQLATLQRPTDHRSDLPRGGMSAVDVLVATPGRLLDHLEKTPGFTLQHLRFLVIDEADRLVSQSYHSFIHHIVEATQAASDQAWKERDKVLSTTGGSHLGMSIDPITWRRRSKHDTAEVPKPGRGTPSAVCQPVQLRKLLFSATLTRDPQKLATLGLVNPKRFDAHHLTSNEDCGANKRYTMPPSLQESIVECTAEQKPLFLLSLLLEALKEEETNHRDGGIMVVFTSSLDSTHRLARLLQLLWKQQDGASEIAEFSSSLSQQERSQLMTKCRQSQDVKVVVCSDGMSRGMDLPQVSLVVNYDVPSFAKTYVHRCGRTARAGKAGKAISLLKKGQVVQFHRMRALIEDPSRAQTRSVSRELVRDSFSHYKACVKQLRLVMQAEADEELSPTDAIPDGLQP